MRKIGELDPRDAKYLKTDDENDSEYEAYRKKNIAHRCQNRANSGLIHWASSRGLLEMTRSIIKLALQTDPKYLDSKNKVGRTALSLAAEKGHVEIIRVLIDAGAFVDAPSTLCDRAKCIPMLSQQPYNFNPLNYAIVYGNETAAALLAQHTKHKHHYSFVEYGMRAIFSPICLAALNKMPSVVRILLTRDPDSYGKSSRPTPYEQPYREPLFCAASKEANYEVMDILLQNGASVRDRVPGYESYDTPLRMSIRHKCFGNAKYLLAKAEVEGVEIEDYVHALHDAAQYGGRFPMLKVLAEYFNTNGLFDDLHGTLYYCVHIDGPQPEPAKYLINLLTIELNRDYLEEGQTYLHWLCQKREVKVDKVIQAVLREAQGIDINAMDAKGYTALDIAKKRGHKTMAALLRSHGAKVGEGWIREAKSLHQLPDHLCQMSLD
ncbi:ankyrin repeat-containing domain protein [Hypoxylon sp. FL1857]|nr:ankyrin repeat-containing domain protein [Hypoxylon sp. FL1857]